METFDNLCEITNQESGIIIYPDSTALATNWQSVEGLPRIFAGTVIGLGEELKVLKTKTLSQKKIQDIVADIQDMSLVSDTDDQVNITSDGKMYKIESNGEIFTVITIDDWH